MPSKSRKPKKSTLYSSAAGGAPKGSAAAVQSNQSSRALVPHAASRLANPRTKYEENVASWNKVPAEKAGKTDKADKADKAEKTDSAVVLFTPDPPASIPLLKLVVQGPATKREGTSFADPRIVDLLDLLGPRCRVTIEDELVAPGSLVVQCTDTLCLQMAHKEICKLMHTTICQHPQAVFWIQSPADNSNDPTYLSVQLIEIDQEDQHLLNAQTEDFRDRIFKVAESVKAIPHRLHMNLELGMFHMAVAEGESTASVHGIKILEEFLAASTVKGAVTFDQGLGDENAFAALQSIVLDANGTFFPCDPSMTELGDTKPRHHLILHTEVFLIEFTVEERSSAEDRFAKLSQMRIFQPRMSEGNIDLGVVCFDHELDWRLRLFKELNLEDVSQETRDIANNIKVAYPKEDADFPIPAVRVGFSLSKRIKRVAGKKTWAVGCKGTRYTMELALYREWPLLEATDGHAWSTGISVHSDAWDSALGKKHGPGETRHFGRNLRALFAPSGTSDGISDFASVAEGILVLTEAALAATNGSEDPKRCRVKDLARRVAEEEASAKREGRAGTEDGNRGTYSEGQTGDDLLLLD